MSASHRRNRYYKQNIGTMLVALGAAAVIYLAYDPVPAGSHPDEIVDHVAVAMSLGDASLESPPEELAQSDRSNQVTGREALLLQTRLLERGLQEINAVSDYSATFVKQEKLNGVLSEPQTIKVKLRQEPFSIYMKWIDGRNVGKQVAYVEGENDDRMLVKFGGLKGCMLPTLKLNPHGDLAQSKARYPITEMGLKKMIERILEFRYRDLELSRGVDCRTIGTRTIRQNDCYCFEINYDHPGVSPKFRKSYIYIDRESCFPVCVKNFGWPLDGREDLTGKKLDDETLLECYRYSGVTVEDQLSAGIFELADTNP